MMDTIKRVVSFSEDKNFYNNATKSMANTEKSVAKGGFRNG